MSDRPQTPDELFDDERLLAYSLEPDDDPGLAAALATSPGLSARLARIGGDVAAVRDGLRKAIPPAPADYAEPGAARWARLRPFFAVPGQRAARRSRRRILVPALAATVLLAVVVAVAIRQGPASAPPDMAAQSRDSEKAVTAAPQAAADELVSGRGQESAGRVVLRQAAAFRDVFVVRAGAIADRVQRLEVVRVLKGTPVDKLRLRLRDEVAALPLGELFVVYVGPLSKGDSDTLTGDTGAGGGAIPPSPVASPYGGWATADGAQTMPDPVTGYASDGDETMVQYVPAGMDVAQLAVP